MDRSTLNLSTTLSSLNQNNNNTYNNNNHHHQHQHQHHHHSYNQVQQFTTSPNSQHQQMNSSLHSNNNDQHNNNSYLNQDHINNTELCEIGHDDISLFLDSLQQQQPFYDGSTITQPIVIPTTAAAAIATTTTSGANLSSNYITTTTTTAPITNMITDDAVLNSYLPYEGLIKENTCNIANQMQNSHVKYSDLQSPPYSLYEGVSPCTSSNDTNISLYSLSISQDQKAKKKT